MIENQVRRYVNDACSRSENVFGRSFFDQHLLVVGDNHTQRYFNDSMYDCSLNQN
jgi:hypothetical protein